MKLTALDVRARRFPTRWRGYDPSSVEAFLDATADVVEELTRQSMKLQEAWADARARVEELKAKEDQVGEVLLTARAAAEERLEAARQSGDTKIAEANAAVETILASARSQRVYLIEEIARLRHQKDRLKAELRALLEAHLAQLVEEEQVQRDEVFDAFPVGQEEEQQEDDVPVVCELGEGQPDGNNGQVAPEPVD